MNEFKDILRDMNIELRKPAPRMQFYRIYLVLDDAGLPLTVAGGWCYPHGDKHITVMWIPPMMEREFLFIQAMTLANLLWNSYLSARDQDFPGVRKAFMAGLDFIEAVQEFKTV